MKNATASGEENTFCFLNVDINPLRARKARGPPCTKASGRVSNGDVDPELRIDLVVQRVR